MKPNLTSDAKTNTFSANESAGFVARQPRMMNEAMNRAGLTWQQRDSRRLYVFWSIKKCFLLIKRCNILD